MENKPKISVVIPHVPIDEKFEKMLDDCRASLSGYDELILVINDRIGYGKAFNRGFKQTTGDFIFAISNDTVLTEGNLLDMCDPLAVTYTENAQWGCFFCLPRWVLKKEKGIGGFDERFGLAYFEDDDYLNRLDRAKIPYHRVKGVKVDHVGGATIKAIANEKDLMNHNRGVYQEKQRQLNEGASLYESL